MVKKFNEYKKSFNGMTVAQLKEHLNNFDDDLEVMILDGFNAQGEKRTINFAPTNTRVITKDDDELGDCEGKLGNSVVILGYGYY